MKDVLIRLLRLSGRLARRTPLSRLESLHRLHTWLFRKATRDRPVVVDGMRFYTGGSAGMMKKFALYGSATKRLREVIDLVLEPGDHAIDIGANVGVYTTILSRRVGPGGSVIAFEPNGRALALLERNLALNGCENVEVLPVALSDCEGEAELYEHPENLGFSSLQCFGRDAEASTVPTATLDGVLESRDLDWRFMKIDVEGAEGLLLDGARRTLGASRRCLVALELHRLVERFGYTPLEVLEPLLRADFRLHLPGPASGGGLVPVEAATIASELPGSRGLLVLAVKGPLPLESLRVDGPETEP